RPPKSPARGFSKAGKGTAKKADGGGGPRRSGFSARPGGLVALRPKCAIVKVPSGTRPETRRVPRGLIGEPPQCRVHHRPRARSLPTLQGKQKLDSHRDALARKHP